MEVKAHLKDLRMSPRKVKIVCDQLREEMSAMLWRY